MRFRDALAANALAWTDDFLGAARCAFVLEELQFALWRPSTVVSKYASGAMLHQFTNTRISETTNERWFSRELQREVQAIERRIARLVGYSTECFEPWQATRYRVGGRFDFHNDAGHWKNDPAGERQLTVLLYLQQPAKGGSTRFRELRQDIEARPGRLLVWRNVLPGGDRDPRMVHASAPVRKGNKTVLVTWIRERPIRD